MMSSTNFSQTWTWVIEPDTVDLPKLLSCGQTTRGQFLPGLFDKRSDYNAALNLFDHPQVTHDADSGPKGVGVRI